MDEINIGNMSFIMLVSIVFPALFLPVQPQGKCAAQDPCDPTVPCDPGSTLVYPSVAQDPCNFYQKCIAPYEWDHQVLCAGSLDKYDDTSCECMEFGECTPPSPACRPADAPPIKGNISEPCFYDNNDRECTAEKEGTTVPDRYYCTRYYKCAAGEWGQMVCPPGGDVGYPYYDVDSSTSPNPCSQYSAVCDLIGFDRCLDPPPPTTTTTTVTTQAPYTGETTVPPHCAPEYPCTQKDTLSNPADCYSYQQCVAPFEWVVSNVNCGGDKGPYDPNFKLCRPQAPCLNLTCTVFNDTTLPASEPCFLPDKYDCVEDYLTVPDKWYCTSYFACDPISDNGTWVPQKCPSGTPYFDITKSDNFQNPPCSNNLARCNSIPFGECLNSPNLEGD